MALRRFIPLFFFVLSEGWRGLLLFYIAQHFKAFLAVGSCFRITVWMTGRFYVCNILVCLSFLFSHGPL